MVEPLRLAGCAPGRRGTRRGGKPAPAGRQNLVDRALDGRRLVTIACFIHLAIGVHAAVRLVQELLTMREMGISESFVNLIEEAISTVVNPLIALGFWFALRETRWLAIAWYVLLSVIAGIVTSWLWRYHVPINPSEWPVQLAGKVMPFFLLVMMFLPRVKGVFARSKPKADARSRVDRQRTGTRPKPALVDLVADRPVSLDRGCLEPRRRYGGLDQTLNRRVRRSA